MLLNIPQVQQMRQLWEKVRAMRADTQAQLAAATQVPRCRHLTANPSSMQVVGTDRIEHLPAHGPVIAT